MNIWKRIELFAKVLHQFRCIILHRCRCIILHHGRCIILAGWGLIKVVSLLDEFFGYPVLESLRTYWLNFAVFFSQLWMKNISQYFDYYVVNRTGGSQQIKETGSFIDNVGNIQLDLLQLVLILIFFQMFLNILLKHFTSKILIFTFFKTSNY